MSRTTFTLMIHDRQGLKDENGIDVLLPPSFFQRELQVRHLLLNQTSSSNEVYFTFCREAAANSRLTDNTIMIFPRTSVYKFCPCLWSVLFYPDAVFFLYKTCCSFLPSVLSSNSFRHEKGNCVQQEYKSLFRNHKNVLVYEKKLGFFFS